MVDTYRMINLFLTAIVLSAFLRCTRSHGRLIEPPSRASAWRYGFNTPPNYNDHELFCGGFTKQWVENNGKCGVCGDAWDLKQPRPHEYGGTYGQGIIVRNYAIDSIITIRVELTASHNGFFKFAICTDYKNTTEECLDKNILKLVKPQDNVDHAGYKYYPKEGSKIYEMRYKLPNISCRHCTLQWRYVAGNNWGNCSNGTGAIGCGPQEEFRACADISIGKEGQQISTEDYPTWTLVSTEETTLPVPDTHYNPVSAILITVLTFLVIFFMLFLLYFHYYQLGRQVKNWVTGIWKRSPEEHYHMKGKEQDEPPRPPPRIKRRSSMCEPGMHEVDLSDRIA